MGYGGGGGGGGGGSGGSGSSGGGGGSGGASGYRRVGEDRTDYGLKVNNITSRDGTRGTEVDGIVKVNTTAHFIPPSGTTAERGSRGRGIIYAGYAPAQTLNIDYLTIATLGNATQFGSDPTPSMQMGANSSSTRMVFGGGSTPSVTQCRYVEITQTGQSMEFANLTTTRRGTGCASNGVRGFFSGGAGPGTPGHEQGKIIDYVNIATKANGINFGDLSLSRRQGAGLGSPTRGVFTGGYLHASPYLRYNVIDYITMSSEGNAIDFGDLTSIRGAIGAGSNATRGFIPGGTTADSTTNTNVIDYLTISSTGNAQDFGDLSVTLHNTGVCPSQTRAVFAGGYSGPTNTNVISYVEIATTGDSQNFGDLTAGRSAGNDGASSDSHGGLG